MSTYCLVSIRTEYTASSDQNSMLQICLRPAAFTLQGTWRHTALWMLLHTYKTALQLQQAPPHPTGATACTDAPSGPNCSAVAGDGCHQGCGTDQTTPSCLKLDQIVQQLEYAVHAAARDAPSDAVATLQSDFLHRRWCRSNMCLSGFLPAVDHVARVQHTSLDKTLFSNAYDRPGLPVIVTGMTPAVAADAWNSWNKISSVSSEFDQQRSCSNRTEVLSYSLRAVRVLALCVC
jgi:hypothetical protein